MTKRTLYLLFFALSITQVSFAQKVKYKDLIVLLNAKQYDKAEPFLKSYLKENDDNPNAYLFMGIVYQDKAQMEDVLLQTNALTSHIDSAILNYDKAYKTITEKEIHRNDEYYEMYSRRDLRTGKFGIKLSDVQLDIEKRIQSLKDRKERVKSTETFYASSEKSYKRANSIFKSIIAKYGSDKDFFLLSDDALVSNLKGLTSAYDSSINAFNSYKTTAQTLGKTKHNQVMAPQEIKDLKTDGISSSDFITDDLKVWDYKKWAQTSIETIEKEITPMRESLIAQDIEINKVREKLKKDSVSVKKELPSLSNKKLYAKLLKYDSDPMPAELFEMKIAELDYGSELTEHKAFKDSADLNLKLAHVKAELTSATKFDSIGAKLAKRDFAKEEKDYKHFVTNAYGTVTVLKSLITSTYDFATHEKEKKQKELEMLSNAIKWEVSDTDSIPLFVDDTKDYKFKPLVIAASNTTGLKYIDSLATGYFYTVTPSHKPSVKVSFPVDKANFKKRNLPVIKGFTAADAKETVFFALIYSENKVAGKYFAVTIAKISKKDGLVWSNNYKFNNLPTEMAVVSAANELSIKTSGQSGEDKLVVIDKTGKMVQ